MFGHHHGDQALTAKIAAFAHGVPVPIWAAAIGVVAAVAAPMLQHVFSRSRDRSLARVEDRRRADDAARAIARVRADLVVRVRAHLIFLGALADASRIDVARWHDVFERFVSRTRDADVIDALGSAYHEFMQPLHSEALAIEVERSAPGTHADAAGRARLAVVAAAYRPALDVLGATSPPAATVETGSRRGR